MNESRMTPAQVAQDLRTCQYKTRRRFACTMNWFLLRLMSVMTRSPAEEADVQPYLLSEGESVVQERAMSIRVLRRNLLANRGLGDEKFLAGRRAPVLTR